MGRAKRSGCRLCMKPTTRGDTSTINNLPKTFAHILEEISGIKFTQADGLHVSVCNRCRDFLQAMEHHSQYPRSNKISGAGKKKVRRLMDKGFSASEAIDKVIAEKRARDLLAGAGVTKQGPAPMGQALQPPMNVQNINDPLVDNRIRMSGAQRKKVQILVAGGVDKMQARQLVLAATAPVMATPYQQVRPMLGGPNQRGPLQARLVQRGPLQGRLVQRGPMQGRLALRGVAQAGGVQRKPVQRVVVTKDGVKKVITQKAPVQKGTPRNGQTVGPQKGAAQRVPGQKCVAQKAAGQKGVQVMGAAQKPVNGPAQRAPNKKNTNTVANPPQNRQCNPNGGRLQNNQNQNRQQNNQNVNRQQNIQNTNRPQNNNLQGGRQQNMGNNRVQNVNTPRRNERVAPYNNNNRGNNQGQQHTSSLEVGIIPINFPNVQLDDMKLDALKEAITNEIVKIPPGGPLIRFLGTSSQNGWLKVICADELSHSWLKMLVGRWERAGVRMVEGNSLPQPVVLSFYLPGDFRSPDEILNIVEKQNTSLNTNQWRVINRETDGNGQTITVCVDEQSFQALQNCDFMVFLGLGVVELKPRRFPSDGGAMPNRALMQNARGNNNNGNTGRGNNNANNNRGGNNMNRSNYNNGGNNSNNYSYGNNGNGGGGMGNNYQGNRSNNSGGGNGGGSYQQRQGMGQCQNYQRAGYQSQRSW